MPDELLTAVGGSCVYKDEMNVRKRQGMAGDDGRRRQLKFSVDSFGTKESIEVKGEKVLSKLLIRWLFSNK